jgi:membrane associated rhomboid family serine protease
MNSFRYNLRNTDTLLRIVFVNILVFLVLALTKVLLRLFLVADFESSLMQWVALPADFPHLVYHPWTIISYMFIHTQFFHILFNMLWLYWMGKIFVEYLGTKKLISTYLLGGIAGAVLYILSYNIFPLFRNSGLHPPMIGASASVLAITVAIATLIPNYKIFVILIGPVSLKYVAGLIVLLDLLNLGSSDNVAHFAHIGGALWGFTYILQLKKGNDLGSWLTTLIDKLSFKSKSNSRMKVKYSRPKKDEEYNTDKKAEQERLDEILDKISMSGYGSLTKEEKEFLFHSSKGQ